MILNQHLDYLDDFKLTFRIKEYFVLSEYSNFYLTLYKFIMLNCILTIFKINFIVSLATHRFNN